MIRKQHRNATSCRARLFGLAAVVAVAAGCRPSPDDPPTKIEDPDAELGPARKKAQEDKKKKVAKKREEAKARSGNKQRAKPATDAKPNPAEQPASAARIGAPAPDFELNDLDGKPVKLADYRGKTVVLEWFNPQCPFVDYAHKQGPLKTMAQANAAKGVVWLSINSGAPGKQGHGLEANKAGVAAFAMSNPVLLDEDGGVGRQYGAKTTPHIFVVKADGTLGYAGGLDNAPRGQSEGPYLPHAQAAIDAILAGQSPERTETRPYGCSVKYAG